jgi:hypothetical protein
MFEELGMFVRFARELRGFLGTQLNESDCLRLVRDHLDNRRNRFLDILRFGVFQNPQSPYRRLLEHAGLALSDVTAMVDRSGIEGALEELYERGVYLTLDEFKTRTPIRRAGLEFTIRPCDLDNSLIAGHYESKTGGSRGTRTRLLIDLDLLAHEAAHTFLLYSEFGLTGRPAAIWRELPPEIVGLKTFLRHAKLGRPIAKWFNHRKRISHPEDLKFYLFTLATRCLARMYGSPMPPFENVALSDVRRVAQWLADMKRQGSPALLDTNPSTGVRVCLAAKENNWDIAGTFFRFSAEPYTDARARIVHEAGCRAASHYSASEAGHIGLACGDAQGVDEVHIMADKVGVIQRHKEVGQSGCSVGRIIFALGLCAICFSNYVSGTTGYAFIVRDICLRFVPGLRRPQETGDAAPRSERDRIYRWSVALLALSPVYIVFTGAEPVALTLMVRSLVVIIIPVLVGTLLKLTTDRTLMGPHRNGWLTNAFMVLLIIISIYLSARNMWEWWLKLSG